MLMTRTNARGSLVGIVLRRGGLRGVVRSNIGNILIGQRDRYAVHGLEMAITLLVGMQRVFNVARALAAEHGDPVHLGVRRAITRNTVTPDTHRNLALG